MDITIGFKTDIGKKRNVNEDYLEVFYFQKNLLLDAICLAIADGVGGHGAGDIASQSAIKEVGERLNKKEFWQKKIEIRRNLNHEFREINKNIYNLRSSKPLYSNMCTTLSVALIYNTTLYLGHVGDSRIYRLRDGVLDQLTTDHTLIQEKINKGTLSKKQALSHPDRAIITRAIGYSDNIDVDIFQSNIEAGDIIILCTDGLSSLVDNKQIVKIIQSKKNPQKACDALVELANRNGGTDNISVIIAVIKDDDSRNNGSKGKISVLSSIKRLIKGQSELIIEQKPSKPRAPSTIT